MDCETLRASFELRPGGQCSLISSQADPLDSMCDSVLKLPHEATTSSGLDFLDFVAEPVDFSISTNTQEKGHLEDDLDLLAGGKSNLASQESEDNLASLLGLNDASVESSRPLSLSCLTGKDFWMANDSAPTSSGFNDDYHIRQATTTHSLQVRPSLYSQQRMYSTLASPHKISGSDSGFVLGNGPQHSPKKKSGKRGRSEPPLDARLPTGKRVRVKVIMNGQCCKRTPPQIFPCSQPQSKDLSTKFSMQAWWRLAFDSKGKTDSQALRAEHGLDIPPIIKPVDGTDATPFQPDVSLFRSSSQKNFSCKDTFALKNSLNVPASNPANSLYTKAYDGGLGNRSNMDLDARRHVLFDKIIDEIDEHEINIDKLSDMGNSDVNAFSSQCGVGAQSSCRIDLLPLSTCESFETPAECAYSPLGVNEFPDFRYLSEATTSL